MVLRSKLWLGLALVLCLGGTAQAQFRSQSAVSGVNTTSSDVFAPPSSNNVAPVITSTVSASVNTSGMSALASLNQGSLAPGVAANIQQNLANLLVCPSATVCGDLQNTFVKNISLASGAPASSLLRQLGKSLIGLQADGSINSTRLVDLIDAYNAAIDNAKLEFLAKPPAEMVALRSLLTTLTKAL